MSLQLRSSFEAAVRTPAKLSLSLDAHCSTSTLGFPVCLAVASPKLSNRYKAIQLDQPILRVLWQVQSMLCHKHQ
jgi:hypothetical protein